MNKEVALENVCLAGTEFSKDREAKESCEVLVSYGEADEKLVGHENNRYALKS